MSKHWKSPEQKAWYQVEADGKVVGVMEESTATDTEIRRLSQLAGIVISDASAESLIKFRAKTEIPSRIYRKMEYAYEGS